MRRIAADLGLTHEFDSGRNGQGGGNNGHNGRTNGRGNGRNRRRQ